MGILGSLLGSLTGQASEQDQGVRNGVARALLDHFTHGGMHGTLEGFRNAGMEQQVNSWVGQGQNMPVTPDQVEQGMGSNVLNQIAQRAGVSPTVAKAALALVLPMVVEHLTPHGQVPQGNTLADAIKGMLAHAA